ncbi:MAG: caspase family protein [Verrucomicrobia bacterium]|nr:caspase family protein [Verrucomicrobiota bacterium]
MRKALVVGIDYYQYVSPLYGCVSDAHSIKPLLERHADGSVNFGYKLLTGTGPKDAVSRAELRDAIKELFRGASDIALLYFAGHGYIESTGGYLLASDSKTGDDGVALSDVLSFANASPAKNKVIILDSCHSGIAGNVAVTAMAELKEGTTILTASTADQYATEENGAGVFTALLVDALSGAASNLVGDVSPGGIYAHIDQSLGPWDQRPVFKTNVTNFVSLREVIPSIPPSDLRRLPEFFPEAGAEFKLDPTFEPERPTPSDPSIPAPNRHNTAIFKVLQTYNRVNLVVPVDAPHMWHAAMESKSCKLTVLGEHYRRLAVKGRI